MIMVKCTSVQWKSAKGKQNQNHFAATEACVIRHVGKVLQANANIFKACWKDFVLPLSLTSLLYTTQMNFAMAERSVRTF